jgi:photosystem II stability/assembly factor-like uncharacterized protein
MIIRRIAALAVLAALAATPTIAAPAGTATPPTPDLHWRLLGPFRGGWATMVEGVPDAPDTFYFGAAGGGVWKTVNAGRTWTSVFDQGPASVGALAIAPSDPNVIYVGTGQPEPRYDVTAGNGVFRSGDGGKTWRSLGLADTRYVGRIWVSPSDANTVLVGAQGHFFGPNAQRGVFRSTDGGTTWSQTLKIDDNTGVQDLASDPTDPKIIFAAAWQVRQYPWQSYFTPSAGPGSGVYKSVDGGVTWARLTGGGWPEGALGRIGLAITHKAGATRVYATVDSPKAGGLYRSDDGGAHWAKVNDGDGFTSYYASRLTVEPNDPDTIYTVGQSIRRCTGGGATCEIIRGSPGGDDYHHIWINPKHPDHIITGSDQGAAVSVDGWRSFSDWYNQPTGQFYHLATDNRFPYRVYSGQQDSGTVGIASRSDYGSISLRDWTPVGGDERDYDIPDPVDPLIVYGSGLGGDVNRYDGHTGQSTDIAAWPVANYGQRPTQTQYHYNWVTPLVASKIGPASLYLGAQLLFRTTDRGDHWTKISGDLTGKTEGAVRCDGDVAIADARPCGYGNIVAIQPSSRHADEIWVGTDDGLIQLTRDGGAHWANVTPAGIPVWAKISTVDVSDLEDGVAYAAVDGQRLDDFQPHVWRTRDYGATWSELDAGLPADHFVSVVRADPQRAGLLYAGTDAGAFVSLDDGAHWSSLQANLPTAWVRDLTVHGDDLVAATQGRAIWVLDDVSPLRQLDATTASQPAHLFAPATAFRVHPDNNHDTPPAPETALGENPPSGAMIDYWLKARPKGPVTLEIHDASGAVVRRFVGEAVPPAPPAEAYFTTSWLQPAPVLSSAPGMHRFVWDLHYARPQAIRAGYSIAAVWGKGAPAVPQGPFVTPGAYQVVLKVDGHAYQSEVLVKEDPRVAVSAADLDASLAFSRKLDAALAISWRGFAEKQAAEKQLTALLGQLKTRPADAALAAKVTALLARLQSGPPPAASFQGVNGAMSGLEERAESADVAPSEVQQVVFDDERRKLDALTQDWEALKKAALAPLNLDLSRAKLGPIVLPPPNRLNPEAPPEGEDLP